MNKYNRDALDIERVLVDEETLSALTEKIAAEIDRDVEASGKELLLVCVLKGSLTQVQGTPAPAAQEQPQMTEAQAQAIAQQQMAAQQAAAASMPTQEQMNAAMGMAYNTKRCPECQAVCFNSPVECPYCHADLKSVKPLTPEKLEKLE